jgi:septal ring factor EnvC (AmiA/AmiB activator)
MLIPRSPQSRWSQSLFAALGAHICTQFENDHNRRNLSTTQEQLARSNQELQELTKKVDNFRGMIARRDEKIQHLEAKLAKLKAGDLRS